MSFERARSSVFTYIITEAAVAGVTVPIQFENLNLIDHDKDIGPFLTFAFHYRSAVQASLETEPLTRFDGEAKFHIHVPKGKGTRRATLLADRIAPFMRYKQVSGVQFQAPRLGEPVDYKAYQITPLTFNFHYHQGVEPPSLLLESGDSLLLESGGKVLKEAP